MTCAKWRGVNILSNVSSLGRTVWDRQCLEYSEQKDESMIELTNEWIPKVFVEQPRLHRVC